MKAKTAIILNIVIIVVSAFLLGMGFGAQYADVFDQTRIPYFIALFGVLIILALFRIIYSIKTKKVW